MGITNEENEYFGIKFGDGLYFKTFKGFDNIVSNEKKITTIIQSVYVMAIFLTNLNTHHFF